MTRQLCEQVQAGDLESAGQTALRQFQLVRNLSEIDGEPPQASAYRQGLRSALSSNQGLASELEAHHRALSEQLQAIDRGRNGMHAYTCEQHDG